MSVIGRGSALQPLRDVLGQAAGFVASTPPSDAVAKIGGLADHPKVRSRRPASRGRSASTREAPPRRRRSGRSGSAWRRSPAVALLLVFDDVQWASPALLAVLEHVAEWARDARILLLCLARPEPLNAPRRGAGHRGRSRCSSNRSRPSRSRELARLLLLSEVAPAVEDTIADVADGNPFFLEEIVTMLQEEGAIVPDPDPEQLAGIAIPPTISALLAARIDRLEPLSRQVLERASVLGLTFTAGHVAALLPDDHGIDVAAVLHDLTQRDFVVADPETPDDGFRFRHALTREAAYESIPEVGAGQAAHGGSRERLGLEPLGETRDERIGFHLEQAHHAAVDLGDLDRDAEGLGVQGGAHLAAAGRAAAGRGDVRAAAGLLERAAVLLPAAHPDRPEILADLHDALFFSGEIERSEAPVAELLASLDPDDESPLAERARLQQAMLRFLIAPGATPIDTLRKEVERSIGGWRRPATRGTSPRPSRSRHDPLGRGERGGDAGCLRARPWPRAHVRQPLRDRGCRAADRVRPAPRECPAGRGPGASRADARALRDDRLARALMRLDEARMLAAVGRSEDAHATVERARTIFADLGQRRWLEMSRAIQAEIARSEGHHEQAEALLRSVHAFFRDHGDANNALDRGRAGGPPLRHGPASVEADALASEVARDAPTDDLEVQVEWRSVRARTQAAAGTPPPPCGWRKRPSRSPTRRTSSCSRRMRGARSARRSWRRVATPRRSPRWSMRPIATTPSARRSRRPRRAAASGDHSG